MKVNSPVEDFPVNSSGSICEYSPIFNLFRTWKIMYFNILVYINSLVTIRYVPPPENHKSNEVITYQISDRESVVEAITTAFERITTKIYNK